MVDVFSASTWILANTCWRNPWESIVNSSLLYYMYSRNINPNTQPRHISTNWYFVRITEFPLYMHWSTKNKYIHMQKLQHDSSAIYGTSFFTTTAFLATSWLQITIKTNVISFCHHPVTLPESNKKTERDKSMD